MQKILAAGLCLALLQCTTATDGIAQSMNQVEQQIIEGTNRFRLSQGRKKLSKNPTLMRTAKAFACYMARTGNYGHTADGRQPSQRAQSRGFPKDGCVGENIAWNNYARQKQASLLTNGWINSPPHRKNMLTFGAKITGVGVCQRKNKFYGVQLIGRKRRASIEIINKTPYPVQYSYGNTQNHLATGTLPGHSNGWRSLTLSTCEFSRLTATQNRTGTNGRTAIVRKSKMIGDKKQQIIFK